MNGLAQPPRAEEELTALEAFRATQAFLEIWFDVGGRESDEIANILTSMETGANDVPLDEALWTDWLRAIDRVRS